MTKPIKPIKPEAYKSLADLVYKALTGGETGTNRALAFATYVTNAGGNVEDKNLPEAILVEATASCTRRFLELHPVMTYSVTRIVTDGKVKYAAAKVYPGMAVPEDAVEAFTLDTAEYVGEVDVKGLDPEKRAAVVALRKDWSDYCRVTIGNLRKGAVTAIEKQRRIADAIAGKVAAEVSKRGRGSAKTYRSRVDALLESLLTLTSKKAGSDASVPPNAKVLAATANALWLKTVFGEADIVATPTDDLKPL